MTENAVTSEPVPAVVGMAISGTILPGTLCVRTLVFFDLTTIFYYNADRLCNIHRGAAAERHDKIRARGLVGGRRVLVRNELNHTAEGLLVAALAHGEEHAAEQTPRGYHAPFGQDQHTSDFLRGNVDFLGGLRNNVKADEVERRNDRDRENGLNRTAGAGRREHLAVQIVHRAVDNRRDDEQDSRAASLRMMVF